MKRSLLLMAGLAAGGLAAASCAEETPGVSPPADQLHYPSGLALVRGRTPAEDRLIVANTNYDQRFNAGSLMSLSVDDVFAAFAALPDARDPQSDPISDNIPISGFTRIPSFGGDIATATAAFDAPRIYIPVRGKNLLITAELDRATGKITCEQLNHPVRTGTAAAFDCDDRHLISTDGLDAFTVAYAPPDKTGTTHGLLAVGHLRPNPASNGELYGDLAMVNLHELDRRATGSDASYRNISGLKLFSPGGIPGITGAVYVPPLVIGPGRGHFLVAGRNFTAQVSVGVVTYAITGDGTEGPFELTATSGVQLGGQVRAFRLRSLTLASGGDRAYVTLHLPETAGSGGNSSNAAVGVLGLDSTGVRLISVVEVGEELGRPVILEHPTRGRLIYIPDLRTDTIWIVDATTDRLVVAGAINGHRDVLRASPPLRRELLAAPTNIVFATRGTRTLGFVTNFANGTLGAIEVTDADPAQHRVIGRLGRVLNADGTTGDKNEER